MITKKSGLCLLQLIRSSRFDHDTETDLNYCNLQLKNTDIDIYELISLDQGQRLIRLFKKHIDNIGVETSLLSLLIEMASFDNKKKYVQIVSLVIELLDKYLLKTKRMDNINLEYRYHGIFCPWFQIKALRLLQHYPPPKDKEILKQLFQILQAIVDDTSISNDVNSSNASYSVLFEVINMIVHLHLHENIINDNIDNIIQCRLQNEAIKKVFDCLNTTKQPEYNNIRQVYKFLLCIHSFQLHCNCCFFL